MSSTQTWRRITAAALPAALAASAAIASADSPSSGGSVSAAQEREQSTRLISRSFRGGAPNGPSTNGVISNDRREARIIAFQSTASNIVRGDTNGRSDVFFIRRAQPIGDRGGRWRLGKTRRASRSRSGGNANGTSYSPAVGGLFGVRPRCVGFISQATNIARRDRNRVADAFVSRGPGGVPRLVSLLPGNRRAKAPTTRVAVSGDCSRIAFVAGGRLYVRVRGRRTRRVNVPGRENDPSFSTGKRNDMVFSGARGVYRMRGSRKPRLVAPGGSDPAYTNEVKLEVVAYVIRRGGNTQVAVRRIGGRQRIVSAYGGSLGDGDSREPVIGNAGRYVMFETEAGNLSVNGTRDRSDRNGRADTYLWSDLRDLTLLESTRVGNGETIPGGGTNPSMSYTANYLLWDSPFELRTGTGSRQVFMRYLGPI